MATSAPAHRSAREIFAIDKFVEKPDAQTAERYVEEGYLWNSGNFMFRAGLLLDEYKSFEPDSVAAVIGSRSNAPAAISASSRSMLNRLRAPTAKSIDYAVMERTKRAAVMPVSYGWSDVGSWQAVWELSDRDALGNFGHGSGHGSVVFVDSRGSYVTSDKQLVALFGVDNLVVVTTDDAVLVAKREDGDGLRRLVQQAQGSGAGGHRGASEGAPALGLLSVDRSAGRAFRSSVSW